MRIIWDENKRQSNLEKHGFDFADLPLKFFLNTTYKPVKNGRYIVVNIYNGHKITVIFSIYGKEALSIISMRPASKKEGKYLK